MVFNSLSFFIFFPIVTILYYLLPHRIRWFLLLIASCIFYMAFIPAYILILSYLIVVDFFAAIGMEHLKGNKRKMLLLFSILSNIGILFFFKYFNFSQGTIAGLAHLIHWNYSPFLLSLVLPIGLSFHTFQSLSYVIEVYKRKQKAVRHFGIYALYVMFYPQLVAGPIERPADLLPQLTTYHLLEEKNVSEGLRRMLFGMFKKLIIADRLSILVTHVYASPHDYVGFPLILATVAFAFQVYCDFSGYTDIAIGSAKVMGFSLRENFNSPYLATSIPDFWRRWHMSLYSWFRDYVYIPLGGNRKGKLMQIRNILIVFFVTGLWHGASWNFVIWGLIHGLYMVVSVLAVEFKKLFEITKKVVIPSDRQGVEESHTHKFVNEDKSDLKGMGEEIPPRAALGRDDKKTAAQIMRGKTSAPRFLQFVIKSIQIALTFTLICAAWVFFRAATLPDALYILTHATVGLAGLSKLLIQRQFYNLSFLLFDQHKGIGLSLPQVGIACGAIILMVILQTFENKNAYGRIPVWARFGIYVVLTLIVVNLGPADQVPFIYFKF